MDPDFFTGWPTCEEEDENANLTRLFKAQYGEMMDAYWADDEDDKAQRIASSLLAKPNLPLFHRGCAHMVMATYYHNPCIHHAKEAIRVLEQVYVMDPDFSPKTIVDARRLLHDAEEFCRRTGQRETNVRKEDTVEEEESDGGSWHTLLFEGEEGFEEQQARDKLWKEQSEQMMQPVREGDEMLPEELNENLPSGDDQEDMDLSQEL